MVCVPQWGSSDGGSPRLPILSTPPFFWADASPIGRARSRASTASEETRVRPNDLRIVHSFPAVSPWGDLPAAGGLSGAAVPHPLPTAHVRQRPCSLSALGADLPLPVGERA